MKQTLLGAGIALVGVSLGAYILHHGKPGPQGPQGFVGPVGAMGATGQPGRDAYERVHDDD